VLGKIESIGVTGTLCKGITRKNIPFESLHLTNTKYPRLNILIDKQAPFFKRMLSDNDLRNTFGCILQRFYLLGLILFWWITSYYFGIGIKAW
jgi:hypothetical protein